MWTTSIALADYLAAPLLNPGLLPPFKAGLYAVGLQQWSGEPKRHIGILYVGSTAKGAEPELLYRVSLLVLESTGFTGRNLPPPKPPKRKRWVDYYHSGGAKVWRYCTDRDFPRNPNDPFIQRNPNREVFVAWCPAQPGRCTVRDEIHLFELLKGEPQFLNGSKPPACNSHP